MQKDHTRKHTPHHYRYIMIQKADRARDVLNFCDKKGHTLIAIS